MANPAGQTETAEALDTDAIHRASQALRDGAQVVFPTETVYGIGVLAGRPESLTALRQRVGLPETAVLTAHVGDPSTLSKLIDLDQPGAAFVVNKLLPGPVTLQWPADAQKLAAAGVSAEGLVHDGLLAVRWPSDPVAQELLQAAGGVVLATGIPGPGGRAAVSLDDVPGDWAADNMLMLDGGRARFAKPSTMVRVPTADEGIEPSVIREGVYDRRFIEKRLRFQLLLVCTGNTCRSPMAEVLAQRWLAEHRPAGRGPATGYDAVSAGAYAADGMPASGESVQAMAERGLDLSRHRSRALTREMLHDADVVFTMTESHRQAVLDLAPAAEAKVQRLLPDRDVSDPIGAGMDAYLSTAKMIEAGLQARLEGVVP